MDTAHQQYRKSDFLPRLGAGDRQVRSTVGTSVIRGNFGWPKLLPALVNCLESNDVNHMEGAMDVLSKSCSEGQNSCSLQASMPHTLHQALLMVLDSPINKAGNCNVCVKTACECWANATIYCGAKIMSLDWECKSD